MTIIREGDHSGRSPIFVCAFRGWSDGGEAATTALTYLIETSDAKRFARIDSEEYFDFQTNRPIVRLEEGLTRRIDWPGNEFLSASIADRDLVFLLGTEPNLKWRSFSAEILEVAKNLDARMLVTLGAFLADVPHTSPVPVVGSAPDPAKAQELGMQPSRYEGPTGIVGVLHDASMRDGIQSVSLWAAVPHYVPGGPNPKGAHALLIRLGQLLEIDIGLTPLSKRASAWESRVNTVVGEDADLAAYVKRLEQALTERDEIDRVPSGDELAEELEQFLRDQRDKGGS